MYVLDIRRHNDGFDWYGITLDIESDQVTGWLRENTVYERTRC